MRDKVSKRKRRFSEGGEKVNSGEEHVSKRENAGMGGETNAIAKKLNTGTVSTNQAKTKPKLSFSLGLIVGWLIDTHVARPARISVKNREPFRSFLEPECSSRKYRPNGLLATRLFVRSIQVILRDRV